MATTPRPTTTPLSGAINGTVLIIVSVWIFNREWFPTVGRVTVIDHQINTSNIQNTSRWVTKGWYLSDCLIIFCISNSLFFFKISSFLFR
jgi:hypothetical protein